MLWATYTHKQKHSHKHRHKHSSFNSCSYPPRFACGIVDKLFYLSKPLSMRVRNALIKGYVIIILFTIWLLVPLKVNSLFIFFSVFSTDPLYDFISPWCLWYMPSSSPKIVYFLLIHFPSFLLSFLPFFLSYLSSHLSIHLSINKSIHSSIYLFITLRSLVSLYLDLPIFSLTLLPSLLRSSALLSLSLFPSLIYLSPSLSLFPSLIYPSPSLSHSFLLSSTSFSYPSPDIPRC